MNPVFEHYMLEQAEQAVNVFRSFNKEDFIDEFADTGLSLIDEAFNDVETLLNYSSVIGANNSISMEECGFIASHINSIERKYKGFVDFNIIASESQGSDFRATLVSEALGKGSIAVLLGLISAILGFILFWRKKKKNDLVAQIQKDMEEVDQWMDGMYKMAIARDGRLKQALDKENTEAKKQLGYYSFTSHSKFLDGYITKNSQSDADTPLQESDYKQAYRNLENRLRLVLEVFECSKKATLDLTNGIKEFIKVVRKNDESGKEKISKILSRLDKTIGVQASRVYNIVKNYSFIVFAEIKSNDKLTGFSIKLDNSRMNAYKGPHTCVFTELDTLKEFHEMCKKNEADATMPWSTASLKNGDTTGIGKFGDDVSDLEKLIKDIDSDNVKLEGEFKTSVLKTAKDLISAFSTMTRQSIGLTLAFRKEQNYAGNFLKELTKHSAKRMEAQNSHMEKLFGVKHTGTDVDKIIKDMEDPNVKTIQI